MSLSLIQKANISLGIGITEGVSTLYLADKALEQDNLIDKIYVGMAAGGLTLMGVSMTWIAGSLLKEYYSQNSTT